MILATLFSLVLLDMDGNQEGMAAFLVFAMLGMAWFIFYFFVALPNRSDVTDGGSFELGEDEDIGYEDEDEDEDEDD